MALPWVVGPRLVQPGGGSGANWLFGLERGHVVLAVKRRVRVPLAASSMRRR
jgi:hypothetical protein